MGENRNYSVRAISSERGGFQNERHRNIRAVKIIDPTERAGRQDFRGDFRVDLRVIMSADFLFTAQCLSDHGVVAPTNHKKLARRERLRDEGRRRQEGAKRPLDEFRAAADDPTMGIAAGDLDGRKNRLAEAGVHRMHNDAGPGVQALELLARNFAAHDGDIRHGSDGASDPHLQRSQPEGAPPPRTRSIELMKDRDLSCTTRLLQATQNWREPERHAPLAIAVVHVVQDYRIVMIQFCAVRAGNVREDKTIVLRCGNEHGFQAVVPFQARRQRPRVIAHATTGRRRAGDDLENRAGFVHAITQRALHLTFGILSCGQRLAKPAVTQPDVEHKAWKDRK